MLLPYTYIIEIEVLLMVKHQDCSYWSIADGNILLSNASGHQSYFHSRSDLWNSLALQVREVKSSESFKRGLDVCIAAKNTCIYTMFVIVPLCLLSLSMPICSTCSYLQFRSYLHLKQMASMLWEAQCGLHEHKLSCSTAVLYILWAANLTVLEAKLGLGV